MKPERWARIEALFDRAKLLPEEQWPLFLAQEATDDITLVDEVLAMLRARAQADFIRAPGSASDSGPRRPDPWVGRKLGEFELLERIGHGGMGVVYRARQESLKRDVAVKVLPFSSLSRPNHLARFVKEARIAAKLRHRNVVAIHAVSQADELHWFAMELVDGSDLSVELKRLRGEADVVPSRLPKPDSKGYYAAVAELVAQAADGLACAHAAGVIHRDVKPSNLLLDHTGTIRLVDFGLARDDPKSQLSHAGEQIGTPHYMSPEQVRRRVKPVDARTDVYSLGVVLYEMLTLRRPFDGKTSAEIWWKIAHHEPPALRRVAPRVPLELAIICATAMARRVFDRYADAAAFRDDLRRFLNHEAIHARPLPLHRRVGRWIEKRRTVLAGAVVAMVALAGGGVLQSQRREAEEEASCLQRIEAVLGLPEWRGRSGDVAAARRALLELPNQGSDLGASARQRADQLLRRLEVHRATYLAEARGLLDQGMAGRAFKARGRDYLTSSDPQALGAAMQLLGELSAIFPDDEEIRSLASIESTFPRVTLRLAPETAAAAPLAVPARVWRRAVDDLNDRLGAAIDMGPPPVEAVAVPPGHWRFIVELPQWGFAEFDRDLVPSVTTEVMTVRAAPSTSFEEPASPTAMLRVDAGTFTFRRQPGSELGCSQVADSAEFEAYWIDRAELSNREYVAYLEATQAPPPVHWSYLGYPGRDWSELPFGDGPESAEWRARWLDLPVVGLTLAEATAVAEWYGKRLPTHVELERALRGEAGLFRSWDGSDRSEDREACNVDGPDRNEMRVDMSELSDVERLRELYRNYLRHAQPVREARHFQRASQLFHAFGNVAEICSSLLIEEVDGHLVSKRFHRPVLGGPWDALLMKQTLASHVRGGIGASEVNFHTGLRCARSAAALPASALPR
ncbi:MAG: protein kinase [Planctomycetes bacterium]|nr:protein kinase [Planctomycetota bacterium]